MSEPENDADPIIPDNFFEDFENNDFLDGLAETVQHAIASEQSDMHDEISAEDERPSSPIIERCLKQIDKASQAIRRKKRRLERELSGHDRDLDLESEEEVPTSSTDVDNTPSSSRERLRRSRSRRSSNERQRTNRSGRRTRSRSRQRRRSHHTTVRRPRSRERCTRSPADRSRSPPHKRIRSTSTARSHSNLSFLEELEQTFARQGKDLFPQQKSQSHPASWHAPQMMPKVPLLQSPALYVGHGGLPNTQGYYNNMMANHMNPIHMHPNPMNPTIMNAMHSTYGGGSINKRIPMDTESDPVTSTGAQTDGIRASPLLVPVPMEISPNVVPQSISSFGSPSGTSRANALKRCKLAIKIINADENQSPKTQFIYNRTTPNGSAPSPGDDATPLKSIKNVAFKFSSRPSDTQQYNQAALAVRSRSVVRVLGFSCAQLIEALRMKSMANRVITKIQEKLPASAKATRNMYVQTTPMECEKCVERDNLVLISRPQQTDAPKMVSIKIQTAKESYSEPLINTLKSMSSAQLVAMSDFAHILSDNPPNNSAEIYKLREQLMDVYNLSRRDDETVRTAERDRLNSVRDRMSNSRPQDIESDIRSQSVNSNEEFDYHRAQHPFDHSIQGSMIREAEHELQRINHNSNDYAFHMRPEVQMDGSHHFGHESPQARRPPARRGAPRGIFPRGKGGANRGFNPHIWHQ